MRLVAQCFTVPSLCFVAQILASAFDLQVRSLGVTMLIQDPGGSAK